MKKIIAWIQKNPKKVIVAGATVVGGIVAQKPIVEIVEAALKALGVN